MDTGAMTFYNHIENVRTMAINLTNGEPWHGAIDKARVFDSLDASRREYMQLQEENIKLRELVWDMYEMAYPEYPSAFEAAFADRMRELGVEVF